MRVIDNFVNKKNFQTIENEICHGKFPFFTSDRQVNKGDGHFQFVHVFYDRGIPRSPQFDLALEFMDKLESNYVPLRIKANCTTRTHEHEGQDFHIDLYDILGDYKTAIYYLNTNNGWTEFEDGTKVESVANRMVLFDGDIKHRGVSQTDTPFRYVINFNYLKCMEIDRER